MEKVNKNVTDLSSLIIGTAMKAPLSGDPPMSPRQALDAVLLAAARMTLNLNRPIGESQSTFWDMTEFCSGQAKDDPSWQKRI